MAKMAELHAELTEIPDEAKSYMQGFYRGRAEGLAVGHEEGAITERERIIKLLEELSTCGYFGHGANGPCFHETIEIIKGENN